MQEDVVILSNDYLRFLIHISDHRESCECLHGQPDRHTHNFIASKTVGQSFWKTQISSIPGFLGSKIVNVHILVGVGNWNLFYILFQSLRLHILYDSLWNSWATSHICCELRHLDFPMFIWRNREKKRKRRIMLHLTAHFRVLHFPMKCNKRKQLDSLCRPRLSP